MKIIKYFIITIFIFILIIPIIMFNFKEDSVSMIDNRKLTDNPFKTKGDLTNQIEKYINDRIGLREEMILGYTVLNDKLFNEMVHPTYTYGKDGYVFFKQSPYQVSNPKFYISFVNLIEQVQKYCNNRNIPFLFVFNPSKASVFSEYLAEGVNYNNSWVNKFFEELDKKKIRYINNTNLLIEKKKNRESVFNKKYDAGHWNDLGAFYGTNAMLEELKKDISTIHINKLDEFTKKNVIAETLPVSKFPIYESVEEFKIKADANSIRGQYIKEIPINKNYKNFGYFKNSNRLHENSPRILSFQGSYMNGKGNKFFQNAFGEYIYIHNYQNIIDFPIYFNFFKPEVVIFEVTEYTFNNTYFDVNRMKSIKFNPTIEQAKKNGNNSILNKIDFEKVNIKKGKKITKISIKDDNKNIYKWLLLDCEYDMIYKNGYYETIVPTEEYEKYKDNIKIVESILK